MKSPPPGNLLQHSAVNHGPLRHVNSLPPNISESEPLTRPSGIHPRIAAHLASLEGQKKLRGYTEKRIRPSIALPVTEQIEAFECRFGVRFNP